MALQLFMQSFGLLNQFFPSSSILDKGGFQFGTFNFCISFLTSSSQRIFGLPIGLLEMGFQEFIALKILVSPSPSNAEDNAWSYTSIPTYVFIAWTALSYSARLR